MEDGRRWPSRSPPGTDQEAVSLVARAGATLVGHAQVYFVTSKRAGYALFALTLSERAAIGVTDDQKRVHVLERAGAEWRIYRDWPVEEHSHTELMTRLALLDEPATVAELVRLATGG